MKVLIIEDNQEVVVTISLAFQIRWPDTDIVSAVSGEEGISLVEKESPDIAILDLGLPDINGFEVLKKIRLFSSIPIIILTVRGEEADIVRGLELGADEYIVKPFKQLELTARVNALLRRQHDKGKKSIVCGSLKLDISERTLYYNRERITLTRIETIVLEALMRNAGHVVTHSSLAEHIWGDDYPDTIRNVKSHIKRLRDRIEPDPGNPAIITTRIGLGYVLITPSSN